MSIISEQVRELRYKADIYNTVGSAWELNRAEAKILQRLLRKAADTIEALSKKLATNGGWIPCSERLPEENQNVIACFAHGTVTELRFYDKKFHGIYDYDEKVIVAWQPLPEEYHG